MQRNSSRALAEGADWLHDELGLIQGGSSGTALLRAMGAGKRRCPKASLLRTDEWLKTRRGRAWERLPRRWRVLSTAEKYWKDDMA